METTQKRARSCLGLLVILVLGVFRGAAAALVGQQSC